MLFFLTQIVGIQSVLLPPRTTLLSVSFPKIALYAILSLSACLSSVSLYVGAGPYTLGPSHSRTSLNRGVISKVSLRSTNTYGPTSSTLLGAPGETESSLLSSCVHWVNLGEIRHPHEKGILSEGSH
jgi:hypothetical protein